MYLYEYLESISKDDLKDLCSDFLIGDNDGKILDKGSVRSLMRKFENYSLVKVRNEVNYEVVRRFVKGDI